MNAVRTAEPEDTRRYIARMCQEMSEMARGIDMPMLSYLLEMARMEAEPEEKRNGLN